MTNTDDIKRITDTLCKRFRVDLIKLLYRAQTGHPGASLSAMEIITTLYYF